MHIINCKNLMKGEMDEVHNWLRQHGINAIRLRREFSDVLPLAELLKRQHPKIIDLYNYPKRNSIQLKLTNWETFNFKVMSKFNMSLSRELMQMLANGVQGAAEILLHEIIRLEKRLRMEKERENLMQQELTWMENDEVRTVVVSKQVGDAIVQVPQKMILYSRFEQVSRECQAKDELLEAFQQRLNHMENIIKVKSERIDELLIQVGKMPPKSVTSSPYLWDLVVDSTPIKHHPRAPAPSAEN